MSLQRVGQRHSGFHRTVEAESPRAGLIDDLNVVIGGERVKHDRALKAAEAAEYNAEYYRGLYTGRPQSTTPGPGTRAAGPCRLRALTKRHFRSHLSFHFCVNHRSIARLTPARTSVKIPIARKMSGTAR